MCYDKFTYNDSFCLQLEKRIQAHNFVKMNCLFIAKLRLILSQDTNEEEEISENLEHLILK